MTPGSLSPRSPRKAVGSFVPALLPVAYQYYAVELETLNGGGAWRSARCPFHDDHAPSLSVNIETGAFCCHACGERGGDIIAFQRRLYDQSFVDACRDLGCWLEGGL